MHTPLYLKIYKDTAEQRIGLRVKKLKNADERTNIANNTQLLARRILLSKKIIEKRALHICIPHDPSSIRLLSSSVNKIIEIRKLGCKIRKVKLKRKLKKYKKKI